jgi:hypothetical protein
MCAWSTLLTNLTSAVAMTCALTYRTELTTFASCSLLGAYRWDWRQLRAALAGLAAEHLALPSTRPRT